MVDDECDAWIPRDVAHPLEPAAGQALGLLVNHEIKVRDLVEPEANRDIVRDARVVGRGEPGDRRELKEIPYPLLSQRSQFVIRHRVPSWTDDFPPRLLKLRVGGTPA